MTPELPAVSYRRLIGYLDKQLEPIRKQLAALEEHQDEHDEWHRKRLETEIETLRLARSTHATLLVSTVSSITAVIGVVIAIVVYASR